MEATPEPIPRKRSLSAEEGQGERLSLTKLEETPKPAPRGRTIFLADEIQENTFMKYKTWKDIPEAQNLNLTDKETKLYETKFKIYKSEASILKKLTVLEKCLEEIELYNGGAFHSLVGKLRKASQLFINELESHLAKDLYMSEIHWIIRRNVVQYFEEYVEYTKKYFQEVEPEGWSESPELQKLLLAPTLRMKRLSGLLIKVCQHAKPEDYGPSLSTASELRRLEEICAAEMEKAENNSAKRMEIEKRPEESNEEDVKSDTQGCTQEEKQQRYQERLQEVISSEQGYKKILQGLDLKVLKKSLSFEEFKKVFGNLKMVLESLEEFWAGLEGEGLEGEGLCEGLKENLDSGFRCYVEYCKAFPDVMEEYQRCLSQKPNFQQLVSQLESEGVSVLRVLELPRERLGAWLELLLPFQKGEEHEVAMETYQKLQELKDECEKAAENNAKILLEPEVEETQLRRKTVQVAKVRNSYDRKLEDALLRRTLNPSALSRATFNFFTSKKRMSHKPMKLPDSIPEVNTNPDDTIHEEETEKESNSDNSIPMPHTEENDDSRSGDPYNSVDDNFEAKLARVTVFESRSQEMPEVTDSTTKNLKLQQAKMEIIRSEAKFYERMLVFQSHYIKNIRHSNLLTNGDLTFLFATFERLRKNSDRLFEDLNKSSDGLLDGFLGGAFDVLVKFFDDNAFELFSLYAKDYPKLEKRLRALILESEQLKLLLNALGKHQLAQGWTLMSFLTLPLGRMKQMAELLEGVVQEMEEEDEERGVAKDLKDRFENLAKECGTYSQGVQPTSQPTTNTVEKKERTSSEIQEELFDARSTAISVFTAKRGSSASLWKDHPKVETKESAAGLSPKALSLQEAKYSLITTTAKFTLSLLNFEKHYIKNIKLARLLSEEDVQILFKDFLQLRVSFEMLFDELNAGFEKDVLMNDILNIAARHVDEGIYESLNQYIKHYPQLKKRCEKLLESSGAFKVLVDNLLDHKLSGRISIHGFFALPLEVPGEMLAIVEEAAENMDKDDLDFKMVGQLKDKFKKLAKKSEKSTKDMLQRRRTAPIDFFRKRQEKQSRVPSAPIPLEDENESKFLKLSHYASKKDNVKKYWKDMPEVVEAKAFEQLTPSQHKLQEAMFEMLTSEAVFITQILLFEATYIKNLRIANILSDEETRILFERFVSLREFSERFFLDLDRHFQEDVMLPHMFHIISQHVTEVKTFDSFIHYSKHYPQLKQCCDTLTADSEKFRTFLEAVIKHPSVSGLTIQSFFIMPVQRATRLSLLMEAVLGHMTEMDKDRDLAQTLAGQLKELARECNDRVSHTENQEKLRQIARTLRYPEQMTPLAMHEGSRTLERRVGVRRMVLGGGHTTQQPLELLLFNDVLVVVKKTAKKDKKVQGLVEQHKVVDYCDKSDVFADVIPLTANPELKGHNAILLTMSANYKNEKTDMLISFEDEETMKVWLEAINSNLTDARQVVANKEFVANSDGEISLSVGDVVMVIGDPVDGVWKGKRLRGGETGNFPEDCVVEIKSGEVRVANRRTMRTQ